MTSTSKARSSTLLNFSALKTRINFILGLGRKLTDEFSSVKLWISRDLWFRVPHLQIRSTDLPFIFVRQLRNWLTQIEMIFIRDYPIMSVKAKYIDLMAFMNNKKSKHIHKPCIFFNALVKTLGRRQQTL